MEKLKEGQIYRFKVSGTTYDNFDNKYYTLKNNENPDDTFIYRVKMLDYQVEWKANPNYLDCILVEYKNGKPILKQIKQRILEDVYTKLPDIHTMKIIAIREDLTTNAMYFYLEDSAKIRHRYYYEKELEGYYKLGDNIDLYVESINGNYLKMKELSLRRRNSEVFQQNNIYDTNDIEEDEYYLDSSIYENDTCEFKSSIVFLAGSNSTPDMDKQLDIISKNICGFLNKNGGTLYLGVADNRRIIGIERDFEYLRSEALDRKYNKNRDGYELALRNAFCNKIDKYIVSQCISIEFKEFAKKLTICIVKVKASQYPAYFNKYKIFIRNGNMTSTLHGHNITSFILDRMSSNTMNIAQSNTELISSIDEDNKNNQDIYDNVELNNGIELDSYQNLMPPIPKYKSKKDKGARIKKVIVFYKDGSAEYLSDYLVHNDDIVWQQEILSRHYSDKNYSIFLCYESGRINRVCLKNINLKESAKGTKNAWNTNDKLVNIFVAHKDDKVAIYSNYKDKQYVKVHNISAISSHQNLYSQGNLCSLSNNEGTMIYHIDSNHTDIEVLTMRDAYTTSKIGYLLKVETVSRTLRYACEDKLN